MGNEKGEKKMKKKEEGLTFAGDVRAEPLDGAVVGQAAGPREPDGVVPGVALVLQLRVQSETVKHQKTVP